MELDHLFAQLRWYTSGVGWQRRTFLRVHEANEPVVRLGVCIVVVVGAPEPVGIVVPSALRINQRVTQAEAYGRGVATRLGVGFLRVVIQLPFPVVFRPLPNQWVANLCH